MLWASVIGEEVTLQFLVIRELVLASGDRALYGTRVSLLVPGEIPGALELLDAARLSALLGSQLLKAGILLLVGYVPHGLLFVLTLLAQEALERRGKFAPSPVAIEMGMPSFSRSLIECMMKLKSLGRKREVFIHLKLPFSQQVLEFVS